MEGLKIAHQLPEAVRPVLCPSHHFIKPENVNTEVTKLYIKDIYRKDKERRKRREYIRITFAITTTTTTTKKDEWKSMLCDDDNK